MFSQSDEMFEIKAEASLSASPVTHTFSGAPPHTRSDCLKPASVLLNDLTSALASWDWSKTEDADKSLSNEARPTTLCDGHVSAFQTLRFHRGLA